MAASRSPQEKKILSYQKDRRNDYGENDKSSRKSIHFRKAWVNRTYRTAVNEKLSPANIGNGDIDDAVNAVRRNVWAKRRDKRLAEVLERRDRRASTGADALTESELRAEAERRVRQSRKARRG